MTDTEETILTVLLALAVLWLLVSPDTAGVGALAGPSSAPPAGPAARALGPQRLYNNPSYVGLVAQAKAEVESEGVDTSEICGAFEITKRAIELIRATGAPAGKLSKPDGTNCDGFAVDIIAYPNGEIYDCIIGKTTINGPAYNADDFIDPSRYVG